MKRELDIYWEDCIISEKEKKELIEKYSQMFKEALKTSNFLKENSYFSWAIVSGYYSMFYKSLILLAKNHNLKPKSFEVHSKVISALHFFYSKKEIANLMNIAYHKIDFSNLPGNLLFKGKDFRNKINYSTSNSLEVNQENLEEFTTKVRDKFITIIDKILEEDKSAK